MKNLKVLAAALLAATTLGLAGCDVDMDLDKENAEAKIVQVEENIYGNKLQEIYDAVVTSGSSNSEKILNNILYTYAQGYFGSFYGDEGLFKAIQDGTEEAFAAKTVAFKGKENAKQLVIDFADMLIKTIAKSFWGVVLNSTYQERSVFIEEKFVKAETEELYVITAPTAYEDDDDHHLIDGTKTYKNVGEYFVGGLEGIMTRYEDYIERSLLPNAYRKALVENYLTTENYGTLGRSYARKIQYVALPNFEGYEDSTKNLVRTYCRLVLEKTDAQLVSDIRAAIPSLTEDKAKEYAAKAKDLHFLDLLYAGYFPEATDKALADMIYSAAGFTAFAGVDSDGDGTIETLPTYAETTYGKLADDWSKLTDSRWETGSVTDFTSGGTYSKNTGLTMKTRDIVASSKVTEGWYTSSGLSDLPSSMKGRLFKMNVANEVDYDDLGKDQLKFTWRLADGSYYLTPETYQTSNTEPYAMFDDSSKTWYIIRIDEAVKVAKLADPEDSDISYGKKEIAEKREAQGKESLNEIVWDVADLIADGDAYRSSARQYFVSKMALAFHDDAIYEYFEATFPDLFD